ncbi:MAG TPA: hypothetical protein VGS12_18295 [Caulobacteraceae bacterium]|nr:hypothetical protein [Caulobacteraceae bacterium]
MRREAAIVAREGGQAAIGIGQLERSLADATGIVSFGICGGLDPALKPGALIIATEVIIEGGPPLRCDPAWTERLVDALPGALAAAIFGGDGIVATAAEKTFLHRLTGAASVDAESGPAARLAHARGLPFAVVRAVCDGAAQNLPPAALVGLTPEGREDFGAVLQAVAARPGQLRALIRLAGQAAAALRALSECGGRVVALTR